MGLIVTVLVGCGLAWLAVKSIHWLDEHQAKKIRAAKERRDLIRHGHIRNVTEDVKADILHGWD